MPTRTNHSETDQLQRESSLESSIQTERSVRRVRAKHRPFRLIALQSGARPLSGSSSKLELSINSAPALLISNQHPNLMADCLSDSSNVEKRVASKISNNEHDRKGFIRLFGNNTDDFDRSTNYKESFQISQHQEIQQEEQHQAISKNNNRDKTIVVERISKRVGSIEDQVTTGDERDSPEPIIEEKGSSTNSSTAASNSSSNPNSSGSEISSCSDTEQVSNKLIRRRTVRRQYHRHRAIREIEKESEVENFEVPKEKSTTNDCRELVVHIDNSDRPSSNVNNRGLTTNSVFRTRQIGSYVTGSSINDTKKSEQQVSLSQSKTSSKSTSTSTLSKRQTTSTSSKCTSQSTNITTNRKLTTSTQHHHHHHSSLTSQSESSKVESSPNSLIIVKKVEDIVETCPEMSPALSKSTSNNNNNNKSGLLFEIERAPNKARIEEIEQQESRVSRSESHMSTSSRTTAGIGSRQDAAVARLRQEAMMNSSSSSSSSMRSKTLSTDGTTLKADLSSSTSCSSSSSSRRFCSASYLGSSNAGHIEAASLSHHQQQQQHNRSQSNSFQAFSSPDVLSLAQEIGTDFAKLESCVESASITSSGSSSLIPHNRLALPSTLSVRLFGSNRPQLAIKRLEPPSDSQSSLLEELENGCKSEDTASLECEGQPEYVRSAKIKELMNVAQNHIKVSRSNTGSSQDLSNQSSHPNSLNTIISSTLKQRNSAMKESIERIEQRMSNLCKKLNDCEDTKQAISLLEIMIQMVEKAWSVPVCGDDLGFRLCACLRQYGGLDFILILIDGAYDSRDHLLSFGDDLRDLERKPSKRNLLKLDLSKTSDNIEQAPSNSSQNVRKIDLDTSNGCKTAKDNDSEILTSDLGLDSASVESLPINNSDHSGLSESNCSKSCDNRDNVLVVETTSEEQTETDKPGLTSEEEESLQKEELVFLSAKLLSQSLTADNRDYLVKAGWLEPVVKLACSFATIKCGQNRHQLLVALSRCMYAHRRSSSVTGKSMNSDHIENVDPDMDQSMCTEKDGKQDKTNIISRKGYEIAQDSSKCSQEQQIDLLAAIGSEILQNMFKHSEETCSSMISLGGLQAILYGCRSSNVETLRHCALALANLALHGGSDSQQMMIEHKAHVWLFPLAFNEDDNVQYYACLAIAILVANQEIESDVLKSSTLNLVEPFVTSHEPRKFAESTTSHIHGQSASWLAKLIPLLESRREEARNLAAFHFAMEAYIKREQAQTKLFRDIEAIEPLRKLGSSPIAIASKFACQALRLIGEKEPHKLSQQVPFWTCEDVTEWVAQVGFEPFRSRFLESGVDGDLLLQLEEQMLERDIGMQNGITRRRFLRELANLKRIADYSSLDKTGLCSLLGAENIQHAYPMLKFGVTRDNIHQLDGEQLLAECRVPNSIHRLILAQSIKSLQDRVMLEAAREAASETGRDSEKNLDVFVSYRRSTGSQLASLLKVHLQIRGFSVFIDVERLEAGKFDNNLLESIKSAKNFILVLSPNALDRCIGDQECKDWVHKETVAALASDCNIIPIMDNFHWPDPEQLPEDMRSIAYFNGIRWIHDYQEACVDKIERFIRGELSNNNYASSVITNASSTNCTIQASSVNQNQPYQSSLGGSLQRIATSTPSIGAPTPLSISSARQYESDFHPLAPFVMATNSNCNNNYNQQSTVQSSNVYLQHSGQSNQIGKRVS